MSVSPLADVKTAKNYHTSPEIRDTLYYTTEEELKFGCKLYPEGKILKQKIRWTIQILSVI